MAITDHLQQLQQEGFRHQSLSISGMKGILQFTKQQSQTQVLPVQPTLKLTLMNFIRMLHISLLIRSDVEVVKNYAAAALLRFPSLLATC